MEKIYVCSKLRGDFINNQQKAKEYCRKIILDGNLPIAPHIYFTQFMDDDKNNERTLALNFNKELIKFCDQVWVFGSDISSGMLFEINFANSLNKKVVYKEVENELPRKV